MERVSTGVASGQARKIAPDVAEEAGCEIRRHHHGTAGTLLAQLPKSALIKEVAGKNYIHTETAE